MRYPKYPSIDRVLAATEADLDPSVDQNQFHMHIRVALDEIDKAINEIQGHDPENDEVKALQECKEWLQTLAEPAPPAGESIDLPKFP